MKLIITGVTGVAGLNIYRAALQDPQITAITLLTRRELPSWAVLPPGAAEKTTTIIHQDYQHYPSDLAAQLAQHDACIWALGKSAVGMSEQEYTVLTCDYPLAVLQALRGAGAGRGRDPSKPFRFLYFSSAGADETQRSTGMWARVKGKAENNILTFCASESGIKAQIYRPGYFRPPREHSADWKYQRTTAQSVLDRVLSPTLNVFAPSLITPLTELTSVALCIVKGQFPDIDRFEPGMIRSLAKELVQC